MLKYIKFYIKMNLEIIPKKALSLNKKFKKPKFY